MSSITLKKIIGVAVGLIIMDMLLPTFPFYRKRLYPSIRRLKRLSKKIVGYR